MKLKNRKAIIVGGSKGIGNEISKHLKELKIKTISCSRKEIDTSNVSSVSKFISKYTTTPVLESRIHSRNQHGNQVLTETTNVLVIEHHCGGHCHHH